MVKRAALAIVLAIAGIFFGHQNTLAADAVAVPSGTMLHCRTSETLTTKLNAQGDAFAMSVVEPVTVNGLVAIPVGATLSGRITQMDRPGRIAGVGRMRLTVEQMTLPDGRRFPLTAMLMAAYGAEHVKVVGNEDTVKGPSSRLADFEEIGGGTAGGILLGAIFAHPVVGGTIALTATTIDRLRRRGKDLTIPIGTQLNYQLTRELALTNSAPNVSAAVVVDESNIN